MEMARHFVATFMILCVFQGVFSTAVENGVDRVLNALLERVESLEGRDAAKEAKMAEMESEISGLKLKMADMELKFSQKEAGMLDEINDLKKSVTQPYDDVQAQQSVDDIIEQQPDIGDDDGQKMIPSSKKTQRKRSTLRKDREAPETEVAFYATHTDHDIHHLGINQVLLFQQAITNIGNGYNNNTGAFVAPVSGTYVFHATVLGIDANHAYCHFDVNGTVYSKFWVLGGEQASQMLIIDLEAGHAVTVRNDFPDEGFVGQHFSTFSGFLLYQHFPSGAVIG